jgi:hypothetical protein
MFLVLIIKVICQAKSWGEYLIYPLIYAGRITEISNNILSVSKTKIYIHIVSQFAMKPVYEEYVLDY